jgi:hypothetical protein
MADTRPAPLLNLLAGEVVEVRSKEEILATLDETGRLEAMPFMPEMLQYCGKRFRVFKRADKTCDNIGPPGFPLQWSLRQPKDAVHLAGVRCDGAEHGNCDAGCLIFWKEAWLKRAEPQLVNGLQIGSDKVSGSTSSETSVVKAACSLESVRRSVRRSGGVAGEEVFSCQATDLREFTKHLYWWDFRQYIRDIRSGNLSPGIADSKSEKLLESILGILAVIRWLVILVFNKFQGIRDGVQYPHIAGTLATTPTAELNLEPGEFVQVRSKAEILATLDRRNKNRGLLFDGEMVRYCGGTFRVLKRVHQIVDEKDGKMMRMKSPCIILEGVACVSEYHGFCPRAIYHYWREAWLQRV